jgi:anti-anti-sigma factor
MFDVISSTPAPERGNNRRSRGREVNHARAGPEHDRIAAEERRGMRDDQHSREPASIDDHGLKPRAAYTIRLREDEPVLVLEGELDLASAPELRRHLDDFDGDGLVVSFKRTTFIDSAVLKELLRARVELTERGVRLVLAAVPAPVRRLMDLTRTSELFAHADSVDEALTQLNG